MLFSALTIGAAILGTLHSRRSEGAQVGVVLGSISGVCGGLSVFFQKGVDAALRVRGSVRGRAHGAAHPYFYRSWCSGCSTS